VDILVIKRIFFIPICILTGIGFLKYNNNAFIYFIYLLIFLLYYIYIQDLKEIINQRNYILILKNIFRLEYIGDNLYYNFKLDNEVKNNIIIESGYFKKIELLKLITILNNLNPITHFNFYNKYKAFFIIATEKNINYLKTILKDYDHYKNENIIFLDDLYWLDIYPLINNILKIGIKDLKYLKIN